MEYITIDINSDCDPVTYAIDTDDECEAARIALRDAGLTYADIWVSPSDEYATEAYKSGYKLYAAGQEVQS